MKARIISGVRPTRIDLQKIRKRIVLSERGRELLQDKLDAMTGEMMRIKKEYEEISKACMDQVNAAYPALVRAGMSNGWRNLGAISSRKEFESVMRS